MEIILYNYEFYYYLENYAIKSLVHWRYDCGTLGGNFQEAEHNMMENMHQNTFTMIKTRILIQSCIMCWAKMLRWQGHNSQRQLKAIPDNRGLIYSSSVCLINFRLLLRKQICSRKCDQRRQLWKPHVSLKRGLVLRWVKFIAFCQGEGHTPRSDGSAPTSARVDWIMSHKKFMRFEQV